MTERHTLTEADAGCYLDGARGHYITRDMIELAVDYGFIIDPFAAYALAHYDEWTNDEPDVDCFMALHDLSDEARDWLNSPAEGDGPRVPGQNYPPRIPEGHYWGWNDGDFGLYLDEED